MKRSPAALLRANKPARVPSSDRPLQTSHLDEGPASRVTGAIRGPARAAASQESPGSPPSSFFSSTTPEAAMRKPSKVDLTDPAALSAWLAETRTVTEHLHALTIDATSPKPHRRHARNYLRAQTRRDFQTLGILLSALDPAATVSPEG